MTENIFEEMDMWKMSANEMNSMTYWYEKLAGIKNIRMPRSIQIPIDGTKLYDSLMRDEVKDEVTEYLDKLKNTLEKTAKDNFGYPVFMRTSHMSSKHSWKKTCFVESEEQLWKNFWALIEDNYLAIDKMPDAIYLREYIPMESYFTGWSSDFPVNKEVRTFFKNGEIMCRHPYWPKEALLEARIEDKDWELKYKKLCDVDESDVSTIYRMLKNVIPKFPEPNGWSCDFAKSKDGKWYLIDMAMYPVSFHYPGCKNIPKVRGRDGKIRSDEN